MNLQALLHTVVGHCGSDIHFKADCPPIVRFDGSLTRLDYTPLTEEDLSDILEQILTPQEHEIFRNSTELDVSYAVEGLSRFRVSIAREMGKVRIVMRLVPFEIPTIREMRLPGVLEEICRYPYGLVLVTGPTGAGKSTTLAAMVTEINRNTRKHIVTLEDPIEFVHDDINCVLTQRQVGLDTNDFASALRTVVRQDPDVILVGEMRDGETVTAAMQAAETGHLVFSTLHTGDALETLHRITDFFPPDQHMQVRTQFANSLRAVVSQRLVPRAQGTGRVAALEILIATSLVKERMREHVDSAQIVKLMEEGQETYGMQTFDMHLYELWEAEEITQETALAAATSPKDLGLRLRGLR